MMAPIIAACVAGLLLVAFMLAKSGPRGGLVTSGPVMPLKAHTSEERAAAPAASPSPHAAEGELGEVDLGEELIKGVREH